MRPWSRAKPSKRSIWKGQPPAVAALLCARYGDVGEQAATATYLDLIARGLIRRSTAASGKVQLQPRKSNGKDLAALRPFERQVYDHVARRAERAGGAVLEEALRLESIEHAKKWMTTFRNHVVADARDRGLVEERPSLRTCFWLCVMLLVPVGFAIGLGVGLFLGLIAYLLSATLVMGLRRPRPSDTGDKLRLMYRHLMRQTLRPPIDGPIDPEWPPDREAAYAVALGVGRQIRSPFAVQHTTLVWSKASGAWRQVRIASPPNFFHNIDPMAVLYVIPGALVFFAIWGRLLFGISTRIEPWTLSGALLVAGWVLWALANLTVWRFVYHGLYDLRHETVSVEGQVIFLEASDDPDGEQAGKVYRVAIDDGKAERAVKYEIDRALFTKLRYGHRLRLDVTPKLGCVRSTRLLQVPTAPTVTT
ncbi:MAG: DUF2207 domain-containing protein [Bradyrhizobium sp.]|uniref:DUF2207 family protein n=1 Tax=Bradyrhizobium sp. TaxID=376 RepID=UPI001D34A16C|nr:DUF2207 domain-containing protein [Bradyrhizobium sp.]